MRVRDVVFLMILAIFFVLPLGVLLLYGFAPGWRFPQIWPAEFDLRAWRYVGGQIRGITGAMGSSVLYSLLTAVATFCMCILPAKVFAREEFRGRSLLEGVLLAPALVPSMTFSMGVHHVFIRLGLADTLAGVVFVLSVFSYPYMFRALVAGYQVVPRGYEVCAANLGAGPILRLVRVEWPLIMPAALAGGSVVFLVAFSEYFLVFLIGGGAVPSYAGYLFPFLTSSDRSVGSLLTLLFLAVPLVLFALLELFVARIYRRKGF